MNPWFRSQWQKLENWKNNLRRILNCIESLLCWASFESVHSSMNAIFRIRINWKKLIARR